MGRYCPNRREQGKYDPSRAAGGGVPGRPGCGHGDRLFPPGFAGGAGWRRGVVASASSAGSDPRSTHGPDSRNGRCKIWPRNRPHGKTTAVRPLFWPSQPARVWTALCRGTLAMPGLCPQPGPLYPPDRFNDRGGGPFSPSALPCRSRGDDDDSISRYGRSSRKPRVPAGHHGVERLHLNTLSALSCGSEMPARTGGTGGS